jgi:predicted RNA polymerase sigma factor
VSDRTQSVEPQDRLARATAESVARQSYGKLIALVAARTRDLAAAEDALSEAFASALSDWASKGCPDNPEAWLLTVARRKTIDNARRSHNASTAIEQLRLLAEDQAVDGEAVIPDQRLALMFACAHPAIETGIRAPLILQAVLGLDAKSIASAFLISPAAMGKRLVRAKEKIREAGIPFYIPKPDELPVRRDAVLDAIYACFAEGWNDLADVARRDLTAEALFLARLVIQLLPEDAETLGLLALMLHADARRAARRSATGDYVPLAAQNPALWNVAMIEEAEALILRASALGPIGRYQIEAALQSAHVHRCRTGTNNWAAILQLYDALLAISNSPVVALNRTLVLAEVGGADVALEALDELSTDVRLKDYQPYWAVRADLLRKTKSFEQACEAYEIAIGLARDPAQRSFLQKQMTALADR